MYQAFYGLKEKPFRIAADPGYLYFSPGHRQALTFLEYGLMEDAGIVLLTGEAGSGKTTLLRYILAQINRGSTDILPAAVFNVNFLGGTEIIDIVLQSFGLPPEPRKAQALDRFHAFLREKHGAGKKVWLIIDEAQNLSREALEEIRMLSNLQNDDRSLLHIMLVGQPELRAKLRHPDLASFSQRIGVQYNIQPLTPDEVRDYIVHRLSKAGGKTDIFESEAIDLIFKSSGGIPRTINLICDAALFYGFGYELGRIGSAVIEQVLRDKGGLGLAGGEARQCATAPGDGAEDTLRARLDALEDRVEHLHGLLEWRLKDLLLSERKRSDTLLVRYIALREKCRGKGEKGEG
jgi:general secretion pathway protein A